MITGSYLDVKNRFQIDHKMVSQKYMNARNSVHLAKIFLLYWGVIFCAQAITKPDTMRVAVHPFPPWIIDAEPGKYTGIDIDIIKKVAEEMDQKLELLECPFARCLKMLETGVVDIMTGLFKTSDRQKYIHFVEPGYLRDPPKVFYRRHDTADWDRYSHLYSIRVGVVRDTKYFPKFDADNNIVKVLIVDNNQLISMLQKGRIDTFIATESTIDYILLQENKRHLFTKATYRHQKPLYSYIGISMKSPLMNYTAELSSTIEKLKQDAFFINTEKQWLGR